MLTEPYLIVCEKCGALVHTHHSIRDRILPARIPADWSFLQIGSAFEFAKEDCQVVGRIRLQLRNDYKNLWCAALKSGKYIWIIESFASFAVLSGAWVEFKQSVSKLHAGGSISLKKDLKLKGEYVEKCEGITYEGVLGEWRLFKPGFFFIQCSNKENRTAVFTVDGNHNIFSISGEKVDVRLLNFKNILSWDEWK